MCVCVGESSGTSNIVSGSFKPVRIRDSVRSTVVLHLTNAQLDWDLGRFGGGEQVKAFVRVFQFMNSIYSVSKCIILL